MAFREGPFQDLRVPLTWTGAGSAIIAIIVALALLFTDRHGASAASPYSAARAEFDKVAAPVTGVVAAPVRWAGQGVDYVRGYFFAVSENRRLRQRIVELERWRAAAIALRNINGRYESLLKLSTQPPIPMVSARVVADVRGPFSNARLADAGSGVGVKVGNPVLSERGVVGRIVGTSKSASRILLLTDIESRTPVLVDRTNARAILTGDGGGAPRLEFLRGRDPVKEGDRILTSGDGGVYPRGLLVGVASKDARGGWRVRLYTDEAGIDYVRILVFDDFSQVVDQAALASAPLPTLSAQERAEIEAAVTGKPIPPPPPAVAPPAAAPVVAAPPAARPASGPAPTGPTSIAPARASPVPVAKPAGSPPPPPPRKPSTSPATPSAAGSLPRPAARPTTAAPRRPAATAPAARPETPPAQPTPGASVQGLF